MSSADNCVLGSSNDLVQFVTEQSRCLSVSPSLLATKWFCAKLTTIGSSDCQSKNGTEESQMVSALFHYYSIVKYVNFVVVVTGYRQCVGAWGPPTGKKIDRLSLFDRNCSEGIVESLGQILW